MPSTRHSRMMSAYYLDVEVWEAARESAGRGYAAETADFEAAHPRPLLADYMGGTF